MSRVTEAGMDGALEGALQRTEQRAVGGVPGMTFEIGGGSPDPGP
jgi:hypothetical protein